MAAFPVMEYEQQPRQPLPRYIFFNVVLIPTLFCSVSFSRMTFLCTTTESFCTKYCLMLFGFTVLISTRNEEWLLRLNQITFQSLSVINGSNLTFIPL